MTQTQTLHALAGTLFATLGLTQTQESTDALLDLLDAHADMREDERMRREADARDY